MLVLVNTHRFYKTLVNQGVTPEQAEGLTQVNTEFYEQALEKELATKANISQVERKIDKLEYKMNLMLALVIMAEVIPLIKDLF